jgi:biotin transport system permease protein
MLESLYVQGNSWLHRLPAGYKLVALIVAGIGLFFLHHVWGLLLTLMVAGVLLRATGVSASACWKQVRGFVWVLAAIGGFTAIFNGWLEAAIVLLRIASLIGLAMAVTLSTPSSALIDTCERALMPLDRLGWVNASKVALALALTLRFVPEIWRQFQEIKEAQAARGLGRHPLALLVPLLVKTLKRAQQIAQAIDARS